MKEIKTKLYRRESPAGANRRYWRFIVTAGFLLMGLAVPSSLFAQADGRVCNNATLNGEYGALVQGVRGISPPDAPLVSEMFVGIALRRFDGMGGFVEEAASQHGAQTGAFPTLSSPKTPATGTYRVNSDCTGTSTLTIALPSPAPPLVIQSDFVIVDSGKEIKEVVTSPRPNVVTAVYTKK